MKRSILFFLLAMILMCSVYAVADENDSQSMYFSSSYFEEGVSANMKVRAQQTVLMTGQQFFGSNMLQRSGFNQNQMSNMQSMKNGNMENMRPQNTRNTVPSVIPSQNVPVDLVPRMQQEMIDREELRDFLKDNTLMMTGVSQFQEYVTPYDDAMQDYLEDEDLNDKYNIYEAAVSWIWVSDSTLNNKQEAWITPAEFLTETPDYDSNPVSGEIVSDCEEQANTLVSLLITSGEYDESTARVVIGQVNFGGSSGGHAWVELYEGGEWFPLDATVGPYYDDDTSKVVYPDDYEDIDFYYFQDEDYSVVDLWYYYNNEYFMDVSSGTGNAPDNWNDTSSSY
ncbi:transglutaminase-like domain-containing protein [Methanolobus psychrotolerans]|uniref:transglutaminase-like domain-containing protein n=1 Tax=Methanolobus psychrotolerans TaxID=1874706 RepID=UPI000B917A07|nr:transglutaminase-like domain-containing protein [Methanolobus psychrotolerans]